MDRKIIIGALLALAIGITGCGKSDSSSMGATGSSTPPKAAEPAGPPETLDQYNQTLADLGSKVGALTTEMQTTMTSAKSLGKDAGMAKVQEALKKYTDGCSKAIDDLEKVNPPADLAKFHKDAVAWNRKVIAATTPMIQAMADSDATKIQAMQKDLQTDMTQMIADYTADLTAAGYDIDAFKSGGKLVKKK